MLYIFWFLHQTTTNLSFIPQVLRCISFDSYIKPQPVRRWNASPTVVYLLIPTSNHNGGLQTDFTLVVVYLLIPTSNHNAWWSTESEGGVVYLLIPTSNHNFPKFIIINILLYIFWFLHQTTTLRGVCCHPCSCISFDSYIKPQHATFTECYHPVVYLLIPTSNHNVATVHITLVVLYIFWFLHQTTTCGRRRTA